MRTALTAALLASLLVTPVATANAAEAPQPIPVPIDSHFNNDGIDSATDRTGNFDGSGYAFPAENLPSGQVTADSVPYLFPESSQSRPNNVVALGQREDRRDRL